MTQADPAAVRRIVESTGFFHPYEVAVAVELVEDRLAWGPASGYHFLFGDLDGRPIGYACFGEIACTRGSFDLYWIAVDGARRGRGLGRRLMAETETAMATMGGRRVYIETSGRMQYASTRGFYEACGYRVEARLVDFYAQGDDKLIFVKAISSKA